MNHKQEVCQVSQPIDPVIAPDVVVGKERAKYFRECAETVLTVTESGHIVCPEGEVLGWVR